MIKKRKKENKWKEDLDPYIKELVKPYRKFDFDNLCKVLCKLMKDNKYTDTIFRLDYEFKVARLLQCAISIFSGCYKKVKVGSKIKHTSLFNLFEEGRNILSLSVQNWKEITKQPKAIEQAYDTLWFSKKPYKIPGLRQLNTKVKNECGIDLLDLYMKRARYYAKKYPSWECYEIK